MKHSILILLIFATTFTYGQSGYELKKQVDGVDILGSWKKKNYFSKDSTKTLAIKIENKNDYAVEVSFVIAFFQDGFASMRSEPAKVCLMPGRWKGGKAAGLCWDSENSERKEGFSWELEEVVVEKRENCK